MSVATTAQLIVEIIGKDALSPAVASAESGLGRLSATSGIAAKSVGLVESAATGMGNALNHAKGFLGGLISGPLGFLGLTAASLGVAGALKSGIDTANEMAISIEKLTALTGESVEKMSGLLAVTGKFGISSQQLGTIVGFEEKTVGKLSETMAKGTTVAKSAALVKLENIKLSEQATGASTKHIDALIKEQKATDALAASHVKAMPPVTKLVALQREYGVQLTDASGKALDFSTILNHVSDYYNSNATQGQKAALAATLFGRGYAALIPVLQLGSKGFAEAQQAAVSLGLTLTSQNGKDLKDYQENWRELGDAIGGLQLQMSLALLPTLNDVAKSITSFVSDHKTDLIAFFKGAIGTAREIGGALVGVGKAAAGAWNAIPGPLRDLLIQALVGNKIIKTVFGIDIVGSIEGAVANVGKSFLSSIAGSLFGKTIATPVVNVDGAVVNVAGGGLGNLPGAAAGGGEAIAGAGVGGGAVETILGAGTMAALAPLAVAAVVPLALNALINSDPAKTGALDLAARQQIAAGRGLSTANVPTSITGRASPLSLLNGGSITDYGKIVNPITGALNKQTSTLAITQANAIAVLNKINAEATRIQAHTLAIDKIKDIAGTNHDFLTLFRSGNAKTAVKFFPAEYNYMASVSKQTASTAVYVSGLKQDITALQKAEVGATADQKKQLNSDILQLQALVKLTTAAVYSVGLTPAALTKLQNTKDQGSSVTVTHVANTAAASKSKQVGPVPTKI